MTIWIIVFTTDPKSLNFNKKYKISYIPNPVDESDDMRVHENTNPQYDLFAMSHGVHRGVLKKGKFDDRENLIDKLIKKSTIKFNIFGMNNIQPVGVTILKKIFIIQKLP